MLFNSYENKLNNFTNEEQIKKVEHINNWITKILWWQLSKDDRLFLIYFKRLLIKKIDSLNNLKEDNIVALENINFDNFNDIYLENLKKARDSSRIADIMALRWAIEQYYQDNDKYPNVESLNKDIEIYINKIPKDEFIWKIVNWCEFWYFYWVWNWDKWEKNAKFRLSVCLEKSDKTKIDWWIYDNKFEAWTWYNDKNIVDSLIKTQ